MNLNKTRTLARSGGIAAVVAASCMTLAACGDTNLTPHTPGANNAPATGAPEAPAPGAPAPAPGAPSPGAPAPGAPAPAAEPAPQTLAWTRTVCTSLNPVLDSMGSPPKVNFADMPGTQRAYADYLARARAVADKAVSDVSAAGVPPVPAGQQASEQVRADLSRLRDNIGDAQQRVATMNLSSPGSVAAAFAAANNVVGSLGSGAQTLASLDTDPQLVTAIQRTDECKRLLPAVAPAPN